MSDIYTVELQGGCGAQSGVVAALAQELAEEARDVAVGAAATSTDKAAVASAAAATAVSASGRAVTAETATEAVAAAVAAALGGTSLASANIAVASRSLLAAASHSPALPAILTELGREGIFVWDGSELSAMVTVDTAKGIYVAPTGQTGSTGAWVRKFDGPINAKWFGATGDGVTNDAAAIQAAIAAANALYTAGYGFAGGGQGVPTVRIPRGVYYMGTTTLDIVKTIIFEGESVGESGGGSTVLKWDAGATGIRVQANNTTGATGVKTSVDYAGTGSIIRNLNLHGSYTSTDGESHGIQLRARASIRDVSIYNFEGDGILIQASAGAGTSPPYEGNANNWEVFKCFVSGCRNGLSVYGADVNAGMASALDVIGNRSDGITDTSFLGNTYVACHAASNGGVPYRAVEGNAACVFLGCYTEGGGAAAEYGPTALVLSGTQGAGVNGGNHFSNGTSIFRLSPVSNVFQVYSTTGTPYVEVKGSNNYGTFAVGAGGTLQGSPGLLKVESAGSGVTRHSVENVGTIFETNSAGINLSTGMKLSVAGLPVVGARQTKPATPTLADVVACLTAHGLWG